MFSKEMWSLCLLLNWGSLFKKSRVSKLDKEKRRELLDFFFKAYKNHKEVNNRQLLCAAVSVSLPPLAMMQQCPQCTVYTWVVLGWYICFSAIKFVGNRSFPSRYGNVYNDHMMTTHSSTQSACPVKDSNCDVISLSNLWRGAASSNWWIF